MRACSTSLILRCALTDQMVHLIGTRSKRVPGHLKSCDRDALNGFIQIAGFSVVGIRPAHVAQFAKILDDPDAAGNDKFVAFDLLKKAGPAKTPEGFASGSFLRRSISERWGLDGNHCHD